MTTSIQQLSRKQALQLWNLLRGHFINAGRVIEEIIDQRAWEPLGYESFTEAWAAQMGEVTIATEIRAHVVYQMYAEGYTPSFIAENVKGVGPTAAEKIRSQYNSGVPVDFVTVRNHVRPRPSAPHVMHIDVGEDAYAAYVIKAAKVGVRPEKIAAEAIADRFAQIV